MECTACHFQSYPALNQFGRAFKAGGYTMIGAQLKIEGTDGLSLPATLNAGVVTKIPLSEIQWPRVGCRRTHGHQRWPAAIPGRVAVYGGWAGQ